MLVVELPTRSELPGDFYRADTSTPGEVLGGEELQWRGTVRLGPLEGLEYFCADGLTDSHCEILSTIPKLVLIALYRSHSVTVSGMEALSRSASIRDLRLILYPLSPAWARAISRMKNLESIYIHEGHDGLTDDSIASWGMLPHLKYLGLRQCWGVKGDFLQENFDGLEELQLVQIPHDTGGRPPVSGDLERNIARLPRLKSLRIEQYELQRELRLDVLLTSPGLDELAVDSVSELYCRVGLGASKSLTRLRFTRNFMPLDQTTCNSLPMLVPELRQLDLSGSELPPRLDAMVGKFEHLEKLSLQETALTLEQAREILKSKDLRCVELGGCKRISLAEVELLRTEFPTTILVYP